MRASAFISYSHTDQRWLKELETMLSPLVQSLDLWSDQRIDPGSEWEQEIMSALDRATVAILLVTSNFLASKFICEVELPKLLDSAQQKDLKILWIPVRHCLHERSPIAKYQPAHSPSSPLSKLKGHKRDEALKAIAVKIEQALGGQSAIDSIQAEGANAAELARLEASASGRQSLADLRQQWSDLEPARICTSFHQAFSRCYPDQTLSDRYPDFPVGQITHWGVLLDYFGDGRGLAPELLDAWRQVLAQPPVPASPPQQALALVMREVGKTPASIRYGYATFLHHSADRGYAPTGDNGSFELAKGEDGMAVVSNILDRLLLEVRDRPVRPLVEIFAPLSLLEADWLERLTVKDDWGNEILLRQEAAFVMRSADRLRMRNKIGGLTAKHRRLINGQGEWVPPEIVMNPLHLQAVHGEERLVALHCPSPSSEASVRERWLQAVLTSMVPLALWPTKDGGLSDSDIQECLRALGLLHAGARQDSKPPPQPVNPPICPDLDALPHRRWQAQFKSPSLCQLQLLMDTPDRLPLNSVLPALSPD